VFENLSKLDFLNAFTRFVKRGGEKLTQIHEYDVADLQQLVTLSVQRNDTHVGVHFRPHPRRILGVLLSKELQHEVSVVQRQIVKHDRYEISPLATITVAVAVCVVAILHLRGFNAKLQLLHAGNKYLPVMRL